MSTKVKPVASRSIWARILAPIDESLSVTAARGLLKLTFSELDLARMSELSAKAGAGELSPDEQAELWEYQRADTILGIIQSKARLRIKRGSQVNGASH